MDGYEKLPNKESEGVAAVPIVTIDENEELLEFAPKLKTKQAFSSHPSGRYGFVRVFTFGFLLVISLLLVAGSVYFIVTNERISKDYVPLCAEGWCANVDLDEFLVPQNNQTYGVDVSLLRAFKIQTLILTSKRMTPEKTLSDKRLVELKKFRKQNAVSLYLVMNDGLGSYLGESTKQHFENFDGFIVDINFLAKDVKGLFDGSLYLQGLDEPDDSMLPISGRYLEVYHVDLKTYGDEICDSKPSTSIVSASLFKTPLDENAIKSAIPSAMILGFSNKSVVVPYSRVMELEIKKDMEKGIKPGASLLFVKALSNIAYIRSLELPLEATSCSVDKKGEILIMRKNLQKMESILLYSPTNAGIVHLKDLLNLKNRFVSYKMTNGLAENSLNKKNHTVEVTAHTALWMHVDN